MRIRKVENFVRLLLDSNTSKSQARALLETANPHQVLAISEIALNLVENQIPLSSHLRSHIKKNLTLFKKLSRKTVSERARYSVVRKQWKLIWNTLLLFKKILLQALE